MRLEKGTEAGPGALATSQGRFAGGELGEQGQSHASESSTTIYEAGSQDGRM